MESDNHEGCAALVFFSVTVVLLLVIQGCTRAKTSEVPVRPTAISAKRASPAPRTPLPTVELVTPPALPSPVPRPKSTAAVSSPTAGTPAVLSTSVSPARHITLTLWIDYPDVLEKAFETALAGYERRHPGVSVVVSKNVDIIGELAGSPPGKKHPDLFSITSDRVGGMAEAGFTIPLDQFVKVVGSRIQSEYEPLAKEGVEYGGYHWIFPQAMGGLAWVYNPNLVPNPPDTISQFLSESEGFRRAHPDDVYFAYPGRGNPYFNAPWFYGFGGYYLSRDGKVGVDTEDGVKGALLVQNLSKLMPPQSTESPETRFMEGRQAWLMTEGVFLEEVRRRNAPFDLAQWPVLDGTRRARPLVVTWGLAISPSTRHPEEAAKMAYYLSTQEFASAMSGQVAFVPAYKAFNDSWLKSHGDSMLAKRIRQIRLGTPFPNQPVMDFLWMPLSDMWEAIWQGGDVRVHLKKAQDAMEQLLKASRGS